MWRAAQNASFLARAHIDFDIMKAKRCPLPDRSPDLGPYMIDAQACMDSNKANRKELCNLNNWKGNGN